MQKSGSLILVPSLGALLLLASLVQLQRDGFCFSLLYFILLKNDKRLKK